MWRIVEIVCKNYDEVDLVEDCIRLRTNKLELCCGHYAPIPPKGYYFVELRYFDYLNK